MTSQPSHRRNNKLAKWSIVAPPLTDFLLVILVAGVYGPAAWRHSGDFIFDDGEAVVRNPVIRSVLSATKLNTNNASGSYNGNWPLLILWTSDFWGRPIRSSASHKSYRPLTTLTFIAECWLTGDCRARVGRLTNVALHAASTVTFRRALTAFSTMENEADLMGAAFFAVHPVTTEAVCSLVGRAELLMAVIALTALKYLAASTAKFQLQWTAIAKFAVLSVISLLCKEQSIMLFPVGALLLFWRLDRRAAMQPATFLLSTGAIVLSARLWINGFETPQFSIIDNPIIYQSSASQRILNYGYTWLLSACLLIAPVSLSADYSSGSIEFFAEANWHAVFMAAGICMTVVAAGFAFFQHSTKDEILLGVFGILFFLPSSHLFITVGFTVAERVLYMPCAAYCGVLARRRLPPAIWTALIGIGLWRTAQRADEWNSSLTLYTADVRTLPSNAKLQYNLAKTLVDVGRPVDARRKYIEVLRLCPRHSQALNNLALLIDDHKYRKNADDDTVERLLYTAVRIQPSLAGAWMNLGVTQLRHAKYTDAEKSLTEALRLRPGHANTLYNLGNLSLRVNRTALARRYWNEALQANPDHVAALHNIRQLDKFRMTNINGKLSSSMASRPRI